MANDRNQEDHKRTQMHTDTKSDKKSNGHQVLVCGERQVHKPMKDDDRKRLKVVWVWHSAAVITVESLAKVVDDD